MLTMLSSLCKKCIGSCFQPTIVKIFDAHRCHIGTVVKHRVPDRVKPSFVIFDIRALWRSSSECPDVKNYKWRLNPVWHTMLYSGAHVATVGVKRLSYLTEMRLLYRKQLRSARVSVTTRWSRWPSDRAHERSSLHLHASTSGTSHFHSFMLQLVYFSNY